MNVRRIYGEMKILSMPRQNLLLWLAWVSWFEMRDNDESEVATEWVYVFIKNQKNVMCMQRSMVAR